MKYSKLSGLGDMLLHLIMSFSDVNGYPLPAYRLNPWKDWGELAYKFQEEHFRLECVPSTFSSLIHARFFTRFSAPETHLRLRFALDLVEVYFQVVHTRLPFLNPTHFRARLNVNVPQYASIYANNSSASGASAEETLHPALMATVVAWGAKFSEHPLLVADRLNSPTRQSGLAKCVVLRPSFVVLRIVVAILIWSLFLVSRGSRRREWSVHSSF